MRAIQWGETHENVAIKHFSRATNLTVLPTGIWLTPTGFLGASSDGLVGDDAVIEVKCPYSYRDDILQEKLKYIKNYIVYFNDDGDLFVNSEHNYYHQMQGILHILNLSICYLIIWTTKGCIIATIKKESSWATNLIVLEQFYVNQYIPKLIESIM